MSSPARSLVITTTGLVGGNLYAVLSRREPSMARTFYPAVEKEPGFAVDIADPASLEPLFKQVSPKTVFLSAALTNVDYCESHPEESSRINVQGTKNVVDACARQRAKLVFFSSDYVFDGTDGPYSETDCPGPICEYGRQKLAAETAVASTLEDYLIIRTTVVFGCEKARKNFCYRLVSTLGEGKEIRVPSDQVGTPTYAGNLAG
ncbi:MAG: SDR family oxidoreductase, partial [Candidatus Omnitrophica bacterium]|nr:SDR family oxidoreductase [Candidatus Omnitrophota bacterium]